MWCHGAESREVPGGAGVIHLCEFVKCCGVLLVGHLNPKKSKKVKMPSPCVECNITYKDHKSLLRHQKSKHGDVLQFNCENCPYTCNRKDNLMRHILKTHSESRKRKLEPEPHVTRKKRKIEPEPHVTRKKIYEDTDIYMSDDEMDVDEAPPPTPQPPPPPPPPTHHSPPTRHPCKDCGKSFTTKPNLYRHIRNHHEHNHLCETCGKTFARPEVYENHKCIVMLSLLMMMKLKEDISVLMI